MQEPSIGRPRQKPTLVTVNMSMARQETRRSPHIRNKRVPNYYEKLSDRWLKESMQDRIVMNLVIYTPIANKH